MIKRPLDLESTTLTWTDGLDEQQTNSEEDANSKILCNRQLKLLSNDGDKSHHSGLVEQVAIKTKSESQDVSEIIGKMERDKKERDKKERDKKERETDDKRTLGNKNGRMNLRLNLDKADSEVKEMDFFEPNLCFEHRKENYSNHTHRKNSVPDDLTMHDRSIPNSVSREFIDTYCRTLEELERCRGKITKLNKENTELAAKLKEYYWDRECHRNEMQAEKEFRERIQKDLRKIVKDMECHRPEVLTTANEAPSCSSEAEIEYFKDQLKVYREDFEQEKDEKLKLREVNSLLTNELEEAKQTIESQQKKLLVYAQIVSSGNGTPVVLPPAYIGRRVQSNPSSPSYSRLHSQGRNAKHFSELLEGCYDERDRRPVYDPIYDVVPKGCETEHRTLKQQIERRTSVP